MKCEMNLSIGPTNGKFIFKSSFSTQLYLDLYTFFIFLLENKILIPYFKNWFFVS
jgi:hypothetical protein